MSGHPTCYRCGRKLRPRKTPLAQAPGTVLAHTLNPPQCTTCRRKTRGLNTTMAQRANELHQEDINLADIRESQYWHDAACKGLAPMFDNSNTTSVKTQRDICNRCPVWELCLADAIGIERQEPTGRIHTFRGGLTASERQRLQAYHSPGKKFNTVHK